MCRRGRRLAKWIAADMPVPVSHTYSCVSDGIEARGIPRLARILPFIVHEIEASIAGRLI